jgi:hypothetical protein
MSNANTMQFMLKEERPNSKIVAILDALFGFKFDTSDEEVPDAPGTMMVERHREGFRESCLAVWPKERRSKPSFSQIAETMATQLNVDVLVEQDDDKWLLAEPGRSAKHVEIEDLEDGADVKR